MIVFVVVVSLVVVPAFSVLAYYALFIETRRFQVVRLTMPTLRSPGRDLKILHISDAHFRKGDEAKMEFVRSLHKEPVDIIVVTGDMIEEDAGIDYCIKALDGFKPAVGMFAVFGAHDRWYSGVLFVALDLSMGGYHYGPPNDFLRFKSDLERIGVVCLENEANWVTLSKAAESEASDEGMWVVGVGDAFVGLDDMDKALAGVSGDGFRILLAHTVEYPGEVAAHGFDAVFAGHSHGGQVRIPLIGAVVTRSRLKREYARGVFEVDGTIFHLNHGLGAGRWTDFRLFCPPEATFVELKGRDDRCANDCG